MQITIDTKTDKPSHIKKAIELLNMVLAEGGEGPVWQNTSASEGSTSPFADMFGESKPAATSAPSNPMGGLLSIFGDDKPSAPATQSQDSQPPYSQSHSQTFPPTSDGNEAAKISFYDDHGELPIKDAKPFFEDEDEPKIKPLSLDKDSQVVEYY